MTHSLNKLPTEVRSSIVTHGTPSSKNIAISSEFCMICLPWVGESCRCIGVIELVCQAWRAHAPVLWELLATLQVPTTFKKHYDFQAYSHKQQMHVLYNLTCGDYQRSTSNLGLGEKARRKPFCDIATPTYFSHFGNTALHRSWYPSGQSSACVASSNGDIGLLQNTKNRKGKTEHKGKITTVIHHNNMVISRSDDSIRQHFFSEQGIEKSRLLVKDNTNQTLVLLSKSLLALGGEWSHYVNLRTFQAFRLHSPVLQQSLSWDKGKNSAFAQEGRRVALFYRGMEQGKHICRLIVWDVSYQQPVFQWHTSIDRTTFPAHLHLLGRFAAGVTRGRQRLYLWDLKHQKLVFEASVKCRILDLAFSPTKITLFSGGKKQVFSFEPL